MFQCENMLEEYEEVVEDWYFNHQGERLEKFLCETHVLKNADTGESISDMCTFCELSEKDPLHRHHLF